jgi:hypothetical protein
VKLEEVELTAEEAAAIRASASPAAVRGPTIVAGFLIAAGAGIAVAVQALLGLVLVIAGVALAVGLVRSLGLPHSDAGRRKGIRLEGPWVLLRAELEEAGSVPPRVLWSLQTVLLGRTEVPPEVGARIDPEGAERLAARLSTGTWPGGARVPVTELSGDDAVIVVGRRSRALGSFELR